MKSKRTDVLFKSIIHI